ncbi:hypothetical protein PDESU_01597 [Pontiella desulfatans]|uniref:PEP-CTERM protein-sorting domain-containing protein n=1 Tax=Pontiella desulfatans TaxID=2750659 RepID=A0A6C2TZL2_PONDE|nr:PEP-CTERM sorting domain-containing protein [Pontiella desulfatans]VGO13043.1 hypothetical protein PDESU_01597 [Pontiella desulfatans]
MKKMIGIACLVLLAGGAHASVVNFTAAEGYSGDGSSWASRLDAQTPTTGSSWDETAGSGTGRFRVDSSAGAVHLDGDAGYNKAIYQEALSSSMTEYTVGMKFSFNRDSAQLTTKANVIAVELTEVASGGNRLAMQLERQPNANSGKYRLSFWENTGSVNTSGNAGWSDETVWGFADAADTTSDDLWLGMTLYRGADASSWMVSGVLSNMLTGASVEMGTGVVGEFDTSSAYFTDDLYALMNSSNKDSEGNFSNRVVDQFSVTAIPEPATLGLIAGFGGAVLFIRRRFMM